MRKRSTARWLVLISTVTAGCGGGPPAMVSSPATNAPKVTAAEEEVFFCQRPLTEPKAVWERIEAVRKLSDADLVAKCGLDFVLVISEWRMPPVDLLQKIVSQEAEDFDTLGQWAMDHVDSHRRAVEAVVAMDIISGVEIGGDIALLSRNRARWQPLAAKSEVIRNVVNEALALNTLLPKLEEIYLKRCMLEVNPLGFAVSCTPIHPAREKIDLCWHEELQDGLIVNLELSRCRGSNSCRKLKKVSREFLHLYLTTVDAMERLNAEVFKARMREWLKLPPFASETAAAQLGRISGRG
jgi:hypothetical protein